MKKVSNDHRPGLQRGRGAVSNPAGRFESRDTVPFDDGWDRQEEGPAALRTTVTPDASRSIISRNDSPDIPFSQSLNPYRGCEHGCVYCFARPTHSYLGLSPGLDFETRLFSKPGGARLLGRELDRPGYRCQVLALSGNTDPYQPVERRLGLTRSLLEVLAARRHPVSIITKSNLVLRDIDILTGMAGQNLVNVFISITTLSRPLARVMEPRAPTPGRRIETLAALHAAGIPAGVLASPMIPGLNDHELEEILEAAAAAGAQTAAYILLRLPHELGEIFTAWLQQHYPARAGKVLSLIRQARGQRLNDAAFGSRMRGRGPYADMLRQRFHLARARYGLAPALPPLDVSRFRRAGVAQLPLFSAPPAAPS